MFAIIAARRVVVLACVTAFSLAAGVVEARPGHGFGGSRGARTLELERVVMLVRHGVRAPLPDEAASSLAIQPWPVWSTPGSFLTPHGREGMRLLGAYDRARYAAAGLLPSSGCPAPGSVSIWANSVERTIASGEALAEGLAPGCGLRVDHLPLDQHDPLFAWVGPEVAGFDAPGAVAAINAQTGGAARIAAHYTPAIKTLEAILGCRAPGVAHPCDLAAQSAAITVSSDGKSIDVSGPIRLASGAAQVLMLQYLEGFPMDQVGWGRAGLDQLTQVSRLHALLFEVYSRPAYIAPRAAHDLAKRLMGLIGGEGEGRDRPRPSLAIIVGHDDNIAAMTALLDAHFQTPGYGYDDPPVGGALIFEVYREPGRGGRFVRVLLQAQTPDQLRTLQPLDPARPPSLQDLRLKACADPQTGFCRLRDIITILSRKLAV
jgi:4-phytase/acid phosphatase